MSWWDTSNLTSFAHQALKTAQKRIDKVLDIKEDESAPVIADAISSVADSPLKEFSEVKEPSVEQDSFFNNWLGNESPATPRNQSIPVENIKPTPVSSSIQRKSKSDEKKKLPEFGESFSSDKLNISKPDSERKVGRNRLSAKESTDKVAKEPQSGLTVSLKSAFKHVKSDRNVEGLIASESSDNNELLKSEEQIGSATTSKVSVVNESNFKDDMFEDKFNEDILSHPHEEVIKDNVDGGIEPLTTSNICDSINSVETRIEVSNKPSNAAGLLLKESEQVFADKKSLFSCSNELEAVSNRNRESDFVAMTESTISVDVTTGWTDASLSQMLTSSASIDCFDSLSQSDADREAQIVDESSPKDDIVMVKSMTIESINTEDQGSSDNLVVGDEEFSSKANMLPTIDSGIDASVEIEDKKEDKTEEVVKFQIGSMVELVEVPSLKEIPSLEGSLETASDDLSESNKTLTAEDSDISLSRDEVEFEDMKCKIEVCQETVEVEDTELKESECVEVKEPLLEAGDAAVTADPLDSEVKAHAESELIVDTGSSENPDRDSDKADSPRSCSSYVKNMLEEAMVESSSGNNGSSSDAVRVESGQTSGHTSADEIDTTTSSDIEIISQLSTPSFGWRSDKPCDLSPTKHNWGRPLQVRCSSPHGGHRRSDSGSSAQSLQSRNGDDFVSPDGTAGHRPGFDVRPKRNNGGENYPNVQLLQENSLLQKVGNESQEKKLAEMNEIIDAREKRQLELSQENIDLQETNSILRNQLKQLEEEREAEQEDIKEVTDEFTRRLAEAEKKFQAAIKEKDMYKKAMQDTELGKRTDNIEYEKVLKEKELTITELLAEGEKLSKQQLQANNHIKKLRSKEKENELAIKSFKTKIDEQKAEIERLEGILDVKVESEKTHVDAINQLNIAMKANKDEINRLKNDLEDAMEKARSFKVALDNSYKEMSELHKARVTDVSEAQKIALSNEVFVKEQLKQALEEHQLNSKRMQSDLITQIEDLQLSMCRMEKEHGRREDVLRQEISDLQQRLQEAEERNQELTQNVSAATRPLLRQIENLQSTYTVQSSSFERVEKNLTDRLTEAQNQLIAAVEKERMASEQLLDTSTRLTGLESQISSIRQDKARLQAELEMERAKVELLDETRHTEVAQKEAAIQKLESDIREFKKEKILLENQLEMEKMKVETEKKKFVLIGDQLREKEMLLQTWSTKAMMSSSTDDHKSTASTPTPLQDDLTSDRLFSSGGRGPVFDNNRVSVYESLRQTSTSSLIESLQSQLKQRDGEIAQLQNDISELERTRESMARELVTLSLRNQDMEEKLRSLATFQKQYMELDQRYNALLQMYGEKVEEADELRLDLLDIKEMYKNQMDELLNRIPN